MQTDTTIRRLAAASSIALLLVLGGCASGAQSSAMAVNATAATIAAPQDSAYQKLLVEQVQGGGETNPMWMSNVSDRQFREALESSLQSAGYLAPRTSLGTLLVSANLFNLERPMGGFNMTVTTQVHYKVKDAKTGAIVFDETVSATGTAKMGESLLAVERLRMANEHAIHNNIEEFIRRFHRTMTKTAMSPAGVVVLASAG